MDSPLVLIASALLLTILVLAGIILILVRHRRQRPYSTVVDPHVHMDRVWQDWMEADLHSARADLRREAREILDPHQLHAVREDLREFEKRILTRPYPLTAIREEMMDSVDRRILNVEILRLPPTEKARLRSRQPDIIQSDTHAREYVVANELRLAIIREYAARRYGDRADNDWFEVYEHAARLKKRLSRTRILHSVEQADGGTPEDSRHQAIEMVDKQLRIRLLQVPPGTSFKRRPSGERLEGNGQGSPAHDDAGDRDTSG